MKTLCHIDLEIKKNKLLHLCNFKIIFYKIMADKKEGAKQSGIRLTNTTRRHLNILLRHYQTQYEKDPIEFKNEFNFDKKPTQDFMVHQAIITLAKEKGVDLD